MRNDHGDNNHSERRRDAEEGEVVKFYVATRDPASPIYPTPTSFSDRVPVIAIRVVVGYNPVEINITHGMIRK